MASPKDFRAFARQCLRWAEEARDERHRQVLRDLAQQWMRAAVQLEKSIAQMDESPPLAPEEDKG